MICDFHRSCIKLIVSATLGVSLCAMAADPAPIETGKDKSALIIEHQISGMSADSAPGEQVEAVTTSPVVPLIQNEIATDPYEYRIGPLDLLEIKVLQTESISRTVRVDSRGNVSLPLIGVVRAAGLSSYDLEQSIADKLGKDYIQDPQVSVFIKEYTSQRVTVQGVVKRSGVYDFPGQASLLQSISLSGGLDDKADETAIKVVRRLPDGTTESMVFDLGAIRQNKIADPLLKGGDVVVVDEAQPITVEGAVAKAGIFYPRGHATLMQVISQAGGMADLADVSTVKVYGAKGANGKVSREYDVAMIRQGKADDPPLYPGDVVVVEKSTGYSIIQGVTNTLRGFIGFGTVH